MEMPELTKCANCEECGSPIYPDYSMCEDCERKINGTVSGEFVNDPHDTPADEREGDDTANPMARTMPR